MEKEDIISVQRAQEDVETSYNLLNNNNNIYIYIHTYIYDISHLKINSFSVIFETSLNK